ncbi:MAG: hypothetical protein AAB922_03765 [Patescibacteria group bacterium]
MSENRTEQKHYAYSKSEDFSKIAHTIAGTTDISFIPFQAIKAIAGAKMSQRWWASAHVVRKLEIKFRQFGGTDRVQSLMIERKQLLEKKQSTKEDMMRYNQLNKLLEGIDEKRFERFLFLKDRIIHEPMEVLVQSRNIATAMMVAESGIVRGQSTVTVSPKQIEGIGDNPLPETTSETNKNALLKESWP